MTKSPTTLNTIPKHLTAGPVNDIHSFSQTLKACGDPLRIQILQVLRFETFGVMELTQLFETKQSGMSHHLKVLNHSGLVEAQREGNAVFYRRPLILSSKYDQTTINRLFGLIDDLPFDTSLTERIEAIQKQRAIQSQAFFAKNADQFLEQQELIANHEQYIQSSFELLTQACGQQFTAPLAKLTVMEIGPGEGLFIQQLSQQFKHIVALDNSNDMLNKAKATALRNGLKNISFYLGDTQDYKKLVVNKDAQLVDAVIMNMVLHHTPTPSQIFKDAFTFLKENGVFIVCDLSRHHQEWAKENCGDLWLGFEAKELTNWANLAGFIEDKSVYIGLRNGFQIQLRKFIKPSH
jgi:ArsR family transcriptional regulator